MFSRLGKWLVFLGLAALLASSVGCSNIRMVPGDSGLGSVAVAEAAVAAADGPRHDLAVISVDIDPPLRMLQIGQTHGEIALLAAIDNKGTYTEQQIAVTATLRSAPDDELLVQRRQVVSNLAPGQATIVRFGGFPSIPTRSGYVLTVAVDSAPGEQDLANNAKSLPLQLVIPQ